MPNALMIPTYTLNGKLIYLYQEIQLNFGNPHILFDFLLILDQEIIVTVLHGIALRLCTIEMFGKISLNAFLAIRLYHTRKRLELPV